MSPREVWYDVIFLVANVRPIFFGLKVKRKKTGWMLSKLENSMTLDGWNMTRIPAQWLRDRWVEGDVTRDGLQRMSSFVYDF